MSRRGFVLVGVVCVLLVIMAVTAGSFFAALQESRRGRAAVAGLRANAAARSGLAAVLAAWDVAALDSLSPGNALSLAPALAAASVTVRRLSPDHFLVTSTSTTDPGAEAQVETTVMADAPAIDSGVVVRLAGPEPPGLRLRVNGVDVDPAGWDCGIYRDTIVTVPRQLRVVVSPNDTQLGAWGLGRLSSWASMRGAGGDTLAWRSFGPGARLSGGRWLGVVVSAGDLVMEAGAEVIGVVVVPGTLRVSGLGGRIRGALVAGAVEVDAGVPVWPPLVEFSSCAVGRSLRSRAPIRPVPGLPATFMQD